MSEASNKTYIYASFQRLLAWQTKQNRDWWYDFLIQYHNVQNHNDKYLHYLHSITLIPLPSTKPGVKPTYAITNGGQRIATLLIFTASLRWIYLFLKSKCGNVSYNNPKGQLLSNINNNTYQTLWNGNSTTLNMDNLISKTQRAYRQEMTEIFNCKKLNSANCKNRYKFHRSSEPYRQLSDSPYLQAKNAKNSYEFFLKKNWDNIKKNSKNYTDLLRNLNDSVKAIIYRFNLSIDEVRDPVEGLIGFQTANSRGSDITSLKSLESNLLGYIVKYDRSKANPLKKLYQRLLDDFLGYYDTITHYIISFWAAKSGDNGLTQRNLGYKVPNLLFIESRAKHHYKGKLIVSDIINFMRDLLKYDNVYKKLMHPTSNYCKKLNGLNDYIKVWNALKSQRYYRDIFIGMVKSNYSHKDIQKVSQTLTKIEVQWTFNPSRPHFTAPAHYAWTHPNNVNGILSRLISPLKSYKLKNIPNGQSLKQSALTLKLEHQFKRTKRGSKMYTAIAIILSYYYSYKAKSKPLSISSIYKRIVGPKSTYVIFKLDRRAPFNVTNTLGNRILITTEQSEALNSNTYYGLDNVINVLKNPKYKDKYLFKYNSHLAQKLQEKDNTKNGEITTDFILKRGNNIATKTAQFLTSSK